MMNDAIRTQISAFVDGELPENESELLLRRMSQDLELRQLAAQYFALSRAIRGQRTVPGTDSLRERIAAVLDDTALEHEFEAIEPTGRRYLRPVAGVAIAATVALAAIVGLQQLNGVPEVDAVPVAEETPAYTVPDAHRGLHTMETGDLDALLATFELREDEIDDAAEVNEGDDDAAQDVEEPSLDPQTP